MKYVEYLGRIEHFGSLKNNGNSSTPATPCLG